MQRRYRRRTAAHYGSSGHSMFGGTGWLFADLLLALALAFLLATTVGSATSIKATPKTVPTVHPTHKPRQASQPPPLELDPVHVTFNIADPTGLATGSPSAVAAIRTTILQKTRGIKNRSAGIVLLFGGNGSEYPSWMQVDQGVEKVLESLSSPGQLFHPGTRYRPFLNLSDASQFSMDIYLFNVTG